MTIMRNLKLFPVKVIIVSIYYNVVFNHLYMMEQNCPHSRYSENEISKQYWTSQIIRSFFLYSFQITFQSLPVDVFSSNTLINSQKISFKLTLDTIVTLLFRLHLTIVISNYSHTQKREKYRFG